VVNSFLFLIRFSQAAGLAVCRRPLRVEARVRKPANSFEILAGQTDTETDSCPSTSAVPSQYHSTIAPLSSLSRYCYYQKDKRDKPGNLETNNVLCDLRPRPRCKLDLRPFGGSSLRKIPKECRFQSDVISEIGDRWIEKCLCVVVLPHT
jgi:hypothetical protein